MFDLVFFMGNFVIKIDHDNKALTKPSSYYSSNNQHGFQDSLETASSADPNSIHTAIPSLECMSDLGNPFCTESQVKKKS